VRNKSLSLKVNGDYDATATLKAITELGFGATLN
jgi:hypothetical protein